MTTPIDKSLRECCNAECGWKGTTDRMLGAIGPLCPDCGEVTELQTHRSFTKGAEMKKEELLELIVAAIKDAQQASSAEEGRKVWKYIDELIAQAEGKVEAKLLVPCELPQYAGQWIAEDGTRFRLAHSWTKMKDRRPEPGSLIVKRWLADGAVWAGVYHGTEKESSFYEWFQLPEN